MDGAADPAGLLKEEGMATKTYDPKKLLRCQCGSPHDFTFIRKCADCGKELCLDCTKPLHNRPYCKPCRKLRADAASREAQ